MLREIILEVELKSVDGVSYNIEDGAVELHFDNCRTYDEDKGWLNTDATIKLTPDMIEELTKATSRASATVRVDLLGNVVRLTTERSAPQELAIKTKDGQIIYFYDNSKKLKDFFKKLLKKVGSPSKKDKGMKFIVTNFEAIKYPKTSFANGKSVKSVSIVDVIFKLKEEISKVIDKKITNENIIPDKKTIKEGSIIYINNITNEEAQKIDGIKISSLILRLKDRINASFTLKLSK